MGYDVCLSMGCRTLNAEGGSFCLSSKGSLLDPQSHFPVSQGVFNKKDYLKIMHLHKLIAFLKVSPIESVQVFPASFLTFLVSTTDPIQLEVCL